MPLSENIISVFLTIFLFTVSFYLIWLIYAILTALDHRHQFKLLCHALENILTSHFSLNNFENTISEIDSVIKKIVKPDKKFPQACASISGLLTQYIYWLNTQRTPSLTNEITSTTLKEISHKIIQHHKTMSYNAETELYSEPLLNNISNYLAKKDFTSIENTLSNLDNKFIKLQTKNSFMKYIFPHIATIIGTIIGVLLTSILPK